MANRKKRLAKGIETLKHQIDEHKIKLEKAKKYDKIELVSYYEKEIDNFENYREKKKRILNK